MPISLIATKLYAPPARPGLTPRPGLWQRLSPPQPAPFVLVCAPAGFGKTTLVVEWLRRSQRPFAWLSLDREDDEPARFWQYAIAALQTVIPGVGAASRALLEAHQLPAPEAVVAALINDLAAQPQALTLVLDDYHCLQSPAIHAGLNDLLDHLPPQLSLVITTREDPPLALARRRARREMLEIRAAGLRFSRDEAADFLNGAMDLNLAAEDIAALDERTEGWIAGLQLAALSLEGRADKHAFVSSIAGDDRYIADYLLEEVLQRQAPAVQDFLLRTSILERFSAALCDAALERTDSAELIHTVERSNLFSVPLDSHREWYRYHHLFGELLRQRLLQTMGAETARALHRRASEWYAGRHSAPEAIEHALAAQDYDQAASLVEATGGLLFMQKDLPTLVRWWQAIPAAVRARNPRLNMMAGWALLATGHATEVQACADMIAAAVDGGAESVGGEAGPAPVNGAQVEIAVLRLSLAFNHDETAPVLAMARQIEPLLSEGQIERLGPGLFNPPDSLPPVVRYGLAVGLELEGQLSAASQAYAEAEALARPLQNLHIQVLADSRLAQLQVVQGHLQAAAATCQRALRAWGPEAGEPSPLLGITHGVLGTIFYERDELEAALPHLEDGIRLALTWANGEGLLPSMTGLARLQLARGDTASALQTADELVQRLRQYEAKSLLPHGEAARACLYARAGHLEPALEWAAACGLDVDSAWSPPREPEAIALARVWLSAGSELSANGRLPAVLRLTGRLAAEAEAGQRWGRLAEVLAIQALAAQAAGQGAAAQAAVGRALALAAPERRVRLFLDLGQPMLRLLSRLPAAAAEQPEFLEQLLTAFEGRQAAGGQRQTAERASGTGLPEALTEREREVLGLIAAGLTNQAIADRLFISLGTVKSHTGNLFGKLGVNNRTQAVAAARAAGLLPPG